MGGEQDEGPPAWIGTIVHEGGEAVAAFDATGTIAYANGAAARLLRTTPADIVGSDIVDLVHPEDLSRAAANIAGVAEGARPRPGMVQLRRADGSWRFLEITPTSVDLPGPPEGPGPVTVVHLRDNQLQDAHWQFLTSLSSGEPFHHCLDVLARGLSSPEDGELVVSYDDQGRRRAAGALPFDLAGVTNEGRLDQTPDTPWADAVASGDPTWVPVDGLPEPIRTRAADRGFAACIVVPVADPAEARPALMIQWAPTLPMAPIIFEALIRRPRQAVLLALERRYDTARLEHLAHHDGLTGLANRERFFAALGDWSRMGTGFGVCYVDLDRFKPINDTLGHAIGDQVLVITARRVEAAAGSGALVARLGGDEFVVAVPHVDDVDLERLAAALVDVLRAPMEVIGHQISVGGSVGCARSGVGQAVDAVVAAADGALYAAKRSGRSTWQRA